MVLSKSGWVLLRLAVCFFSRVRLYPKTRTPCSTFMIFPNVIPPEDWHSCSLRSLNLNFIAFGSRFLMRLVKGPTKWRHHTTCTGHSDQIIDWRGSKQWQRQTSCEILSQFLDPISTVTKLETHSLTSSISALSQKESFIRTCLPVQCHFAIISDNANSRSNTCAMLNCINLECVCVCIIYI